jgi:hypothetical protein
MSSDAIDSGSNQPADPSTPREPARRMTQRELVILSLLKRPDDSQTRELD